MTVEEIANLEKQETLEVYGHGHFELEKVLKEIENLKITKDKENLLRKLIDFDSVWDYDSLALKY
jgi:hypothetical protein